MPLHDEPQQPPGWPIKIIRCLLRPEFVEEIEGDMYEEYQYHLENHSKLRARYLYSREVLKIVRSSLLKRPFKTQKLNTMGMLSNYSKVALRNMRKHKMNAFIKIGGFAIGIAISLLICLFVVKELETDRHLTNTRVYRIIYETTRPDRPYRSAAVPPILAPSMKKDYPEITEAGRALIFDGFGDSGGNLFRPVEQQVSEYEEKFGYADQAVLDLLDFQFVHGDAGSALKEPYSLIMSASKAEKYYPNENPVGKTVFINENIQEPYVIKGVFEELHNSHLRSIDFFFTLADKEFWAGEQASWCCYNYMTYIQLDETTQKDVFETKLKRIHDNYFVAFEKENDPANAKLIEQYGTLDIQHVSEIYLYSADVFDFAAYGDIKMVRIFGAIALFILLLACINFVNLATANSAMRAKEIGLRKAIGSGKRGIVNQFLVEAVILSLISVLLGVLLALLASPLFSQIIGKPISLPFLDPIFYVLVVLFAVLIGFVSGIYPAVYLSSVKTIAVLGGKTQASGKGSTAGLRGVLVVFQFAISMFLIAGALIVFKQMDYILTKDLGYDKEQVLMINGTGPMGERMLSLKAALAQLPEVESASFSDYLPVDGTNRDGNLFWNKGMRGIEDGVAGQFWGGDDDYFETLGIEIIAGRAFDNDRSGDSISVVVNEAMVRQLGLEDPINAEIENWRPWRWKIIGVMKDFNYDHMSLSVMPLMIARGEQADLLAVKLHTEDMVHTIGKIEKVWDNMNPNQTMRTSFLDQDFTAMYEDVIRTRSIFLSFALFAILVACLGLTGLVIYAVSARTKEITIRKVLGASIRSILALLTLDYLKLILLAILIASPICRYFAEKWLEEFAYRTPSIWDSFVVGGVLLLIIALTVVSLHSIKAARQNPALGLRDE